MLLSLASLRYPSILIGEQGCGGVHALTRYVIQLRVVRCREYDELQTNAFHLLVPQYIAACSVYTSATRDCTLSAIMSNDTKC